MGDERAELIAELTRPFTFRELVAQGIVTTAKRVMWKYPLLHLPKYIVIERRRRGNLGIGFHARRCPLFTSDYDLVVDGYWRSANTYLSCALRRSQPHLRVRSHAHNPLYPIQAIRCGKPVCLLIRAPVDAIASLAIHSQRNISIAAVQYLDYYRPLVRHMDKLVVIRFEECVKDLPAVIRRINKRTYLRLHIPDMTERFLAEVYKDVQNTPWGADPLTMSLPVRTRTELAEQVKVALREPARKRQLAEANELYRLFATHAET